MFDINPASGLLTAVERIKVPSRICLCPIQWIQINAQQGKFVARADNGDTQMNQVLVPLRMLIIILELKKK